MEYQDTASSFDRKFTFSEAEIKVVQDAIKTGLYKADEPHDVRRAKWAALFHNLCTVFGIPPMTLVFNNVNESGYGKYDPATRTITLGSRYSLTTMLHFFTIALLVEKREDAAFNSMVNEAGFSSPQEMAAAFSLSLFREAAPEMYAKAKEDGRLNFFESMDPTRRPRQRRATERETFDDDEAEPEPGAIRPDIDPENKVDRGNGLGED